MTADAAHNPCQGCGTDLGDNPPSTRCGDCPPWTCLDCGDTDSMTAPCGCWVTFDGLPLADIKGHLAALDLSVGGTR